MIKSFTERPLFMFKTNHYETLGIDINEKITPEKLIKAYANKKAELANVPDPDKIKLAAIEEAYGVLSHRTRAAFYYVEMMTANTPRAMAPKGFFTPWERPSEIGNTVINFIALPLFLGLAGAVFTIAAGLTTLLLPFSCCVDDDNEKNKLDDPSIWEMFQTLSVLAAAAIGLAIIAPIVIATAALTRTLTSVAVFLFEHAKEIGESCQGMSMGMGGFVPVAGI